MRQTSLSTYHQIKDEGLLSKLRMQVYSYVFHHGPCTAKQVAMGIMGEYKMGGTVSSRFSELERLGVIASAGTVVCPETNRMVTLWDVTKNLPEEPKKKLTNVDKIKRLKKAYMLLLPFAPDEAKLKAREILHGRDVDT